MSYLPQKKNPYIYHGPLDPVKNKLVIINREDNLKEVISGIKKGDYWVISGPRQIGKSTFLRQIEYKLKHFHHVYINFESTSNKNFYKWIAESFNKQIPNKSIKGLIRIWESEEPHIAFYKFLEQFTPIESKGKIVLYFDEIEGVHNINEFLNVWKKLSHDRSHNPKMKKYAVVMVCSGDFIDLTIGKNSPYYIARYLYMRDFSKDESTQLIMKPFKRLGIDITPSAIIFLNNLLGGHPQLMQHACHILTQKALIKNRILEEVDIEQIIHELFINNISLDILKDDLERYPNLKKHIEGIFCGKPIPYSPNKNYSILGAGSIKENDSHNCCIRNQIYELFLKNFFITVNETSKLKDSTILSPDDSIDIKIDPKHRFTDLKPIGEGGMGKIYKALDKNLDMEVALKLVKPEIYKGREDIKNLKNEAKLAVRLSHANIVKVLDFVKIKNDYYILMEFIQGLNLEQMLSHMKMSSQFFTNDEIIYLAIQILNAIDFAHKNEIIHRDIKSKNVMITSKGKVKIVDFGLALILKNCSNKIIENREGTPFYMAPEQIGSKLVDYRTDIYSFGITLYEILTLRVPFMGKPDEIFCGHLFSAPKEIKNYRKNIPEKLEEIVMKCLEKEPNNRYQSAGDIIEDLKSVIADSPGDVIIENLFIQRIQDMSATIKHEVKYE